PVARHSRTFVLALRRAHHEVEDVVAAGGGLLQYDLVLPPRAVLREHAPDEFVAPAVATGAEQHRADVLQHGLDAKPFRHLAAQAEAFRIGVLLRHEDAQYITRAERAHAKRGDHSRVDAARKAEHRTFAPQVLQHLLAQCRADALHLGGGVDLEGKRVKAGVHAATSSLRAIFPFSLFGNCPRNSTVAGTMKSSSRLRQCRMMSASVTPSSAATMAFSAWPRIASGTPITQASRMPAIS